MTLGQHGSGSLASVGERATTDSAVYITTVGKRRSVQFTDGSELILNTNTSVRVQAAGLSRVLDLREGEVLVTVTPSSNRRIHLRVGGVELDTAAAQVHARLDRVGSARIEMLSGNGWIKSTHAPRFQPLFLRAGHVLRAQRNTLNVERFDRVAAERHLAWTRGEVLLRGETLMEAVAEFNRYNDRQLVIGDGAIASLSIGGRFDATDLDAFVASLDTLFGIKVRPARTRTDTARIVLVGTHDEGRGRHGSSVER